MGIVIDVSSLPNEDDRLSRLLVYMKSFYEKTKQVSISKQVASAILQCKPNRRSMRLSSIMESVLSTLPDGVIVRDIDVLFNPSYEVDVLKMLIELRKQKNYSVIWPGRCENGKLIYGEEGFPDYKTYNIENYDIACVIGGYEK